MLNPRSLIDSILVPHTAFQKAQTRLEQCFSYVQGGASEPVCVALIGESRTGKSRCIEVFQKQHPPVRYADGLQLSVVHVTVPSKPTVKSLAEHLLHALGAPDWDRGTETVKTVRLIRLVQECGVKVLALDEFQHFYDKSSRRVQHAVTDWLKNVIGATKVALFVSGLPSLQCVIDQNEQLAGRFISPIHMPRFDWQLEDHRSEWLAILDSFTEGIRAHFDLPDLGSDSMSLRMYCATGGLMGYLTRTLRQAVWTAVDTDSRVITMDDIRRAHLAALWSNRAFAHLPSPFDPSLQLYPSPELLAQTSRIGTLELEEPVEKPRAAKAHRAGDVLRK